MQADRYAGRQVRRQVPRQTGMQTDRYVGRQTGMAKLNDCSDHRCLLVRVRHVLISGGMERFSLYKTKTNSSTITQL